MNIVFYGRDYSPIMNNLVEEYEVDGEVGTDGNQLKFNRFEQINIIRKFLDDNRLSIGNIMTYPGFEGRHKRDITEIYQLFNGQYYWGGFVGIIKGEISQLFLSDIQGSAFDDSKENKEYSNVGITIQIYSRFDGAEGEQVPNPYFLLTMLMGANSAFNDQPVPNNPRDFVFDLLLMFIFKERAKKCYQKGIYKAYHRFENNDDRIKGNIDIARHIKLNMGLNNGKAAYSYRENTYDNYLNHLIIAAFDVLKVKHPEALWGMYFNPENEDFKAFIDSIKMNIEYPKYDVRTLMRKNIYPISHPYYVEYEGMREIALRVLRDDAVSFLNGREEDVQGILIYIPDLWEIYLRNLIQDESNYHLNYQFQCKIIDYEDSPGNFVQEIRPDYVFFKINSIDSSKNEPFMILDAKFKPAWGDIIDNKKSFSDVMEDYNKCIRDMNSINGHASGVIFPTNKLLNSDIDKMIKHTISEYNLVDSFYTFPIYVPKTSDRTYSEWRIQFNEENMDIIKKIKESILDEKNKVIEREEHQV